MWSCPSWPVGREGGFDERRTSSDVRTSPGAFLRLRPTSRLRRRDRHDPGQGEASVGIDHARQERGLRETGRHVVAPAGHPLLAGRHPPRVGSPWGAFHGGSPEPVVRVEPIRPVLGQGRFRPGTLGGRQLLRQSIRRGVRANAAHPCLLVPRVQPQRAGRVHRRRPAQTLDHRPVRCEGPRQGRQDRTGTRQRAHSLTSRARIGHPGRGVPARGIRQPSRQPVRRDALP